MPLEVVPKKNYYGLLHIHFIVLDISAYVLVLYGTHTAREML